MISKEITVGYWSTKALGSALRMLVIYSGRPLRAKIYKLKASIVNNVTEYDGSSWHDGDKITLKKTNNLINLPYVEMYDEGENKILISQSLACLSILGRKLNYFGNNSLEEIYCEQLLNETQDLRGLTSKFSYTVFNTKAEELTEAKLVMEKASNKINGKLLKFEEWLSQKKKNENKFFLVGNSISVPDFALFDILDSYIAFINHYGFSSQSREKIYDSLGFTFLSNFYNEFKKLPRMQKYFNSELYKLPYQNKAALFSSNNITKKWDPVTEIDYTPDEILIDGDLE
ncbi:glutathione S-transferase family protein [Alphaproteobacteria bacterium]|nr:glutathione S-transferase family protein [Alphaproteobacteria bacterium]